MRKQYCRFYADTPEGEVNKYFSWRIKSKLEAYKCLAYFEARGLKIRAAYYVDQYNNSQRIK